MIQTLKLFTKLNHKLDFVFSSLLVLSLYLWFDTSTKIIWIIISIILFIAILNKPFYFIYVILMLIIAFLIRHFINLQDINTYFKGTKNVLQTTSIGPIVQINGQRVLIKSKEHFGIWDQIHISGAIKPIKNFSDFDFKTYMRTFKVNNSIDFPSISIISRSQDLRSQAIEYLSTGPKYYKKVAPLILLGKKTIESKKIYLLAFQLTVVHLFVISGFHISLLYLFVKKILMQFKLKEDYATFLGLLPVILYIVILNFPLSATRAAILVIVSTINIYIFKKKYSLIQILSFVLVLMFLINPYSIYSLSYIFTFIATFVIVYINSLKFQNKSTKFFMMAIGAYFSNWPIAIFLNGWISIFGFIYGIILAPLFVVIYISSLFLFPIKTLMNWVYQIFILILKMMNSINIIIQVNKLPLEITQGIYILPISYLIMNKIWHLYLNKNNILLTKRYPQ